MAKPSQPASFTVSRCPDRRSSATSSCRHPRSPRRRGTASASSPSHSPCLVRFPDAAQTSHSAALLLLCGSQTLHHGLQDETTLATAEWSKKAPARHGGTRPQWVGKPPTWVMTPYRAFVLDKIRLLLRSDPDAKLLPCAQRGPARSHCFRAVLAGMMLRRSGSL